MEEKNPSLGSIVSESDLLLKKIDRRRPLINILYSLHSYSTIPIAAYAGLHVINLVIPLILTPARADSFMTWTHTVTPQYTGAYLLVAAATHVFSSTLMKYLQQLDKADRATLKEEKYDATRHFLMHFVKGRSAVSLSGSALVLSFVYHVTIMKVLPMENASRTGLSFVMWLLQNDDLFVKWVLGFLPLCVIANAGIYHIVNGSAQFLKLKYKTKKYLGHTAKIISVLLMTSIARLMYSKPIFDSLDISGFKSVVDAIY